MARRLGLVKIAKSSAKDLFELGVPLVLVGNKVNDHHFFGGWHLAMDVDSQRYLREDESFDSLVNNWSHYNENPETGKAAFFVDKKHIGGKGGVGGGKRRKASAGRSSFVFVQDDRDFHGAGCGCGVCDSRGVSYGVAVYRRGQEGSGDPEERVYGPSAAAAMSIAKRQYGGGHAGGGKRRHAKQWKLVTARGGEVLGRERAPSARQALSAHRAKGHGTTGVAAVRAGGKRRHAPKQPGVGKLARELDSMLK
jgi:hypothetical protein